ncbi:MAG: Obg family GTPase CgtA, partial [Clostridia bacterium]|nr:Obg family GTPase CgtA [Clostridia bacterium]
LGVVSMGEGSSFVMADIPGLIEGAGDGVGLGHEFLRHVDRCRLLVHIVDAAGSEGRDPIDDFEIINKELEKFDPELAKRPQIVAANKIDLATDEQLERLRDYFESRGYEYHTICAPITEGTTELVNAVWNKLHTLPPIKKYETEIIPLELYEKQDDKGFTIKVIDDVYFVEGKWLLKILQRTDLDDYESLQYFQRILISSGIIDALREKGINEGDTVSIYDLEFDFVN